MTQVASREEVAQFVNQATFDAYQSVPLPHGLTVPGNDHSPSVEVALRRGVAGKSLLDVGACYGLFSAEAIRRGATRVVALEPDPARAPVAKEIANLWGDAWSVHDVSLDDFQTEQTFDVVLFLNVLHHVIDPVRTLERLVQLADELLVIEFCQPSDQSSLGRSFGSKVGSLTMSGRVQSHLYRPVLRLLQRRAPLITLGPGGSRTWYFSREAMTNLLIRHTGWVKHIEFERSPRNPDRQFAFCEVYSPKR